MKNWLLIFLSVALSRATIAAEPELKITKDIALKAVVLFRQDPLSEDGRGAGAILVQFAEKSPDVLLRMSSKSMPFIGDKRLSDKQRGTLLAAFIAGNVDSQLLHDRKGDDPYAGDLQVIETYRQMQKMDPKLHNPGIEKLIALESKGQLKQYLSSK